MPAATKDKSEADSIAADFHLGRMALLGRRVAELHRALAKVTGDPAFDPQPVTGEDLEAWKAGVELAPAAPTVMSLSFACASVSTGTAFQSTKKPVSTLGVPSQLNLVASKRASRAPSSGSNGVWLCRRPIEVPSVSAPLNRALAAASPPPPAVHRPIRQRPLPQCAPPVA